MGDDLASSSCFLFSTTVSNALVCTSRLAAAPELMPAIAASPLMPAIAASPSLLFSALRLCRRGKWVHLEGEMAGVMLVVMPCRSEKSQQGVARCGRTAVAPGLAWWLFLGGRLVGPASAFLKFCLVLVCCCQIWPPQRRFDTLGDGQEMQPPAVPALPAHSFQHRCAFFPL